jgi:glycosyltransferase involved in cell wall biosynthesis
VTEKTKEKPQRRILQIFSRYREYGGEEGSVYRIGDALQHDFDVGFFIYSSADLFSGGKIRKGIGVLKAVSNWEVVAQLRRRQDLGGYQSWLIHNVYPAMSPSVYALAFSLGIPVIQYLHNYRMGCINGFFMNHGEPCQRCMHGNFLPALQTACWHESHLQSGIMGGITMRARSMDLFRKIDRWIAISEAQKKEHVLMGIPENRIDVVPHFLESHQEAPAYPLCGDVLFVGRLSKEKGVDRLLAAWELLQQLGRVLWIVGDGPEREKLEKIVASRRLQNVRFTGFLKAEEMAWVWANTACSVVPSIWKEPFGMVVLESWAKSRPVVAHRIGALPEIIEQAKSGLLVEPNDPGEMADAIERILVHPEQGEAMGREGLLRLKSHFSKDEWREKILKTLKGY